MPNPRPSTRRVLQHTHLHTIPITSVHIYQTWENQVVYMYTHSKTQFCSTLMALKDTCLHAVTKKPYIKSLTGGINRSQEGHSVSSLMSHTYTKSLENRRPRHWMRYLVNANERGARMVLLTASSSSSSPRRTGNTLSIRILRTWHCMTLLVLLRNLPCSPLCLAYSKVVDS